MPDNDTSESILRRICELQEKQLEALAKFSEHLSQIAAEGRKTADSYQAQNELYEQRQKDGIEERKIYQKAAAIRGFLILIMLGLIAGAIIFTHLH